MVNSAKRKAAEALSPKAKKSPKVSQGKASGNKKKIEKRARKARKSVSRKTVAKKAAGKKKNAPAKKPLPYFVHPKGLADSNDIGPRTRIWAFAHVLEGAVIGADCNIGECVFVETGAILGDRVTVKNGVQLWTGVTCVERGSSCNSSATPCRTPQAGA